MNTQSTHLADTSLSQTGMASSPTPSNQSVETRGIIGRFFHREEPLPIRVQGIVLYGLWDKMPVLSVPTTYDPHISYQHECIGLWYATRITWQSNTAGEGEQWINETEMHAAFNTLNTFLDAIVASGRPSIPPVRLVYRLPHVQKLDAQQPGLHRIPGNNVVSRINKEKRQKAIKRAKIDLQEALVEDLQRQFSLDRADLKTGWLPSRFTHYDQETKQRGWIVVSPRCSLIAGLGVKEVQRLISLIQYRDIDTSGRYNSIASESYDAVLARIMLWNGAQEVAEAVGQIEELVASGKQAVDGQILLSFALAVIGVLLTIFPYFNSLTSTSSSQAVLHLSQIIALALIVVASGAFWIFARSGGSFWWKIGLFIMALSIILGLKILWYDPLLHLLFSLLHR